MESFIGEIRIFGGNFAPEGWAFCNGQLLQIAEYDTLFSLIGTTYGGDGNQTFGVPNLNGRVAVGSGQGSGLSAYSPGQAGGAESVTLTTAQMPSHGHAATAKVLANKTNGTVKTPNGNVLAANGQKMYADPIGTSGTMAANSVTVSSSPAGGNGAHENRQPSLTINYIIALYGIYPSPA